MSALLPARLLSAFEHIVGRDHVILDPDRLVSYDTDWTGRYRGKAPAAVRPASTAEVAAIVSLCADEGIALCLRGGNTGLVGGSVPLDGECVLHLDRLRRLEIDPDAGRACAEAGVSLGGLQDAARRAGWEYAVDFSSRDSATVGGSIATNAGGFRAVRHGTTRAQMLGVEAVLGDGRIVSHLDGAPKEVTGYDLAALLCGSEGTLGVVTAAALRLVPPSPERVVALLGFTSTGSAFFAAVALRRCLPHLEALEIFFGKEMSLVSTRFELPQPLAHSYSAYLLIEVADTTDPAPRVSEAIDGLAGVGEVAVAVGAERRSALWRYRETIPEAIASVGVPHKLDVSLPSRSIHSFVEEVPEVVRAIAPGAETWIFGHAGEGNLHVNVCRVAGDGETVDEAVLTLVTDMGGSISGEHGIGVAKKRWLHLNRSETEIAVFRSLKRALDPAGVLNPNVLLP